MTWHDYCIKVFECSFSVYDLLENFQPILVASNFGSAFSLIILRRDSHQIPLIILLDDQ